MSKKIGRFDVKGELGRGAQSVVYLGFDPQLQREIAIKTLHFGKPDPQQNQTLLNEARTVGKLRHPNIVPIFEAGEEAGDLYLVFEYVPGKNLAAYLRESGALPSGRAIALIRPILDAVAYANGHGVIHRDLKPSNILIDENGLPRVMDFGIAARVDGPAESPDEYTGTPAYMAPEYIAHRQLSERSDVFAAGLILYELLTGQRAAQGDNIYQVMNRVANEDIRLPAGVAVDQRLGEILNKALARDPCLRYQSANQFAEALDAYLAPEAETAASEGKQSTIDFLLRRMRHKSDFPALSESVTTINKIAASETESVNKLSNSILKDFALTNKILRLVNSAYFRPAGGGSISTVSRAVIVLGFDVVRNIAISVLLFEHLQNKSNANQLKEEFLRANLAGILGKELGGAAQMRDLEQSFICALFHNLGRLLSQYYFPEEAEEIRRLAAQRELTEDVASQQVLGVSYEEMGIEIARQWGFPPLIVGAMRRLPDGLVRKPVTPEERQRVLSGMANELCQLVAQPGGEGRDKEMRKIMARYAAAVPLSDKEVKQSMQRSVEEVAEFARIIHLNLQQTTFGKQMRQFFSGKGDAVAGGARVGEDTLSSTVLKDEGAYGIIEEVSEDGRELDTRIDAQAILTAGIQDISNTLVDGFKLNDILRIILETMYRAMGFKRVILCVRDAKTNSMIGRFGFGPNTTEVVKTFRFPLSFSADVFHVATSKGVDILINDINDPKIAPRVPGWYRKALPAQSMVLFPLNIKNNPVALIYADRDEPGGISIPEKELSLLRTLRNQAVLAIKQGS
ncbi:HDOD domain-containing protein [Dechloromonas sp. ZY10]|uniref:protein kinase domain-containing protein n=1 Tax=Dechloromonas aquae TaxID=2664436 RepID=UPI003528DAFA